MIDLTDEQIRELVEMEKRPRGKLSNPHRKAGHVERDLDLTDAKGRQRFVLYTRQNMRIPGDFSCGLRWRSPSGEDVMLARYNGRGHIHRNGIEGDRLEHTCHIHLATERYMRAGLAPEGHAEATTRYDSLDSALDALARDMNIQGLEYQVPLT